MEKHSSLLRKSENYEQNFFYNIDHTGLLRGDEVSQSKLFGPLPLFQTIVSFKEKR
jgi:hypothetical protein